MGRRKKRYALGRWSQKTGRGCEKSLEGFTRQYVGPRGNRLLSGRMGTI